MAKSNKKPDANKASGLQILHRRNYLLGVVPGPALPWLEGFADVGLFMSVGAIFEPLVPVMPEPVWDAEPPVVVLLFAFGFASPPMVEAPGAAVL